MMGGGDLSFFFFFQPYSRLGRLKRKSHKIFDIIVLTKSEFLEFRFRGWGYSPVAPPPP